MTKLFKLKEKFKLSDEAKMIFTEIFVFCLAFILMDIKFIFSVYPFGLAYLCSLKKYTLFGFCGCLLSVIFNLNGDIVYLIALCGILGLRIVGSLIQKKDKHITVLGEKTKFSFVDSLFCENTEVRVAISVFCAFGIGLYRIIVNNYSYYEIFLLVFFSVLVGILTFALSLNKPKEKLIPYGIILFALLYSFSDYGILSLNVSIVLGYGLILYLSRHLGGIKAGAYGLILGLCVSPPLTPIFAIGGIVSGLLWKVSVYLAVMCGAVLSIGYGVYVGGYTSLIEVTPSIIFVSLLAYPLLKFKMLPVPDFIKENQTPVKTIDTVILENEVKSNKQTLSTLSDTFFNLSQYITEINKSSKFPTKEKLQGLCTEVCESHCFNCPKHFICWQNDVNTTHDNLRKLSEDLYSNGSVNKHTVEEKFLHRCPNIDNIIDKINLTSKEQTENAVKNNKLEVSSSDYGQISKLISSVIKSKENEEMQDVRLSEKLKRSLAKIGLVFEDAKVIGKENKEVIITCVNAERSKCSLEEFKSEIEYVLGVSIEEPIFVVEGSYATVTVKTKYLYSANDFYEIKSKKGEEVCGDNVAFFNGTSSKKYTVICDGMGSGYVANVTSLTCVNFLKSILSVTNDIKIALSMLNGLLRAKGLESSSTVDLLEIDLITGKGSVTKCGASTTYVKRGNKVFKLQSQTMPIGILKDLDAEKLSFELSKGDVCIMVSDGVIDSKDNDTELVKFIENFKENIDTLPAEIIKLAKKFKKDDDMTVCVTEIA